MKEINMTGYIMYAGQIHYNGNAFLNWQQHRPGNSFNYLPKKYITSEILDSIFKTDDYGWRCLATFKIPEEKRNRQIF